MCVLVVGVVGEVWVDFGGEVFDDVVGGVVVYCFVV